MSARPEECALDRSFALSRVGGDLELLKEIGVLFLTEYPAALAELHGALVCSDAAALERAAHGVKGSVATFGARNAVEAARRLESMGRSNQLADAAAALADLEGALAALRDDIEAL